MENVNKNPLEYFQSLLEKDKSNELKTIYISEIIEHYGSMIEKVDNENGIVTYWDFFYDESTDSQIEGLVTYDFNKSFNSTISSEFVKAKKSLDSIVLSISYNGISPKEFINIQILLLKDLFVKTESLYLDKPIVKNAIVGLINYIQEKYLVEKIISINTSSPNLIDIEDYSEDSLNWDSLNPEDTIPNIEKLYDLLIQSPALIESSKEDFIKAFTMRKVTNGIKWLVIGKNGSFSKSSLFYFIEKLIEEGLITDVPSTLLNKKIHYLFRDPSNNRLKNIRQSKSTNSSNPSQKDRIDSVINSIFI